MQFFISCLFHENRRIPLVKDSASPRVCAGGAPFSQHVHVFTKEKLIINHNNKHLKTSQTRLMITAVSSL